MRCLNHLVFSSYLSNSNVSNLPFVVSTTLNWQTWQTSLRAPNECTGSRKCIRIVAVKMSWGVVVLTYQCEYSRLKSF